MLNSFLTIRFAEDAVKRVVAVRGDDAAMERRP